MDVSRATVRSSFAPEQQSTARRTDTRSVLIMIIVSLGLAFGLAAGVLYGTTADPAWDAGVVRMG